MTTLPPRPLRRRGTLSTLGISTIAAGFAVVSIALHAFGAL